MAELLTPRTLDLEAQGSASPVALFFRQGTFFYSTLSFSAQVNKFMSTGNILLGGNPAMD